MGDARRQRARAAVRLVLLALALVVFVRLDTTGVGRTMSPKRELSSSSSSSGNQWQQRQQRGLSSAPTFGVLQASAAYLDSIGQLTNVMNEFVNSLLEKVSFLAEIIIESSLEEECPLPFTSGGGDSTGATTTTTTTAAGGSGDSAAPRRRSIIIGAVSQEACRAYERRHNLTRPEASGPGPSPLGGGHRLSRADFDESEFKDIDQFLSAYLHEAGAGGPPVARPGLTTSGGGGGGGCKLFTFELSPEDLPANDMGLCCYQFQACYASCGRTKLACDRQFRACLTGICRANFNYRNESLVRAWELARRKPRERRHATTGDELEDSTSEADAEAAELLGYEPIAPLDEEEEEEESADDEELAVAESSQRPPAQVRPRRAPRQVSDSALDSAPGGGENGAETGEPPQEEEPQEEEEVNPRAIKRMRDKYKACKLASKLLIIGNLAFGCQNYRRAQWAACCTAARAV